MDAYQAIITRKCVRSFTPEPVTDEQLNAILEAGVRAPSGMANEPWRFSIIRDRNVKAKIAALSKHEAVLLQADALICLFMDTSVGYHTIKDANTIGACTENMLLAAHALGLGAVWIAEILKNKEQVTALCGVDGSRYELCVVLPVGHSAESAEPHPRRLSVADCVLTKI